MLLQRDIDLPRCFLTGKLHSEIWCWHCELEFPRQFWNLRETFFDTFSKPFWSEPKHLAARCSTAATTWICGPKAVSPYGAPLEVTLKLDDGQSQEVNLLGLPRHNEEGRKRLEQNEQTRARRAKASNARRVRSQPSYASTLLRAELEMGECLPKRRSAASAVKCKFEEVARSKEAAAEQRARRLRNMAKLENKVKKRDDERAKHMLEKSMAAQVASRRAARKRSGRR